MPPRGVSAKRKRQYQKIKQSAAKRGKSAGRAKEIAARTVNKQRRKSGETKSRKRTGTSAKARTSRSSRSSSGRSRSRRS
jgi:hypothetical protein